MALLDLLLPASCAGCGRFGTLLCERCVGALQAPGRDEDRFFAADPAVVVGDDLEVAIAAFAYRGPARSALLRMKYGGATRLAAPLAAAAQPTLATLLALTGTAALVPVPVHAERLRTRGFNQAELLAVELGKRARLPVSPLLARRLPTLKQHRLGRAARLRNLRGAFVAEHLGEPPEVAILVDDILTTSATLEACAMVLRAGGVRQVCGFAIAREV
jgi:ComF family protein